MQTRRFYSFAALGVFIAIAALVIGFTFAAEPEPNGITPDSTLEGKITVRGVGLVEVEPDQVILTFSVRGVAEGASEAMALQAVRSVKANEVLQGFGVEPRDIQTQRVSLTEDREYRDNRWVRLGYIAEQRIQVVLNDMTIVGSVIDALVEEAEVDSIHSIDFQRRDRQAAAEAALRAAYAQAEARARLLVEAAGAELVGAVLIYDETADTAPVALAQPEALMLARDSSVGTVVQGGMLTVEARVRVEFLYRQRTDQALTTDKASYRVGEPIVLTLRNASGESLGYNLCSSGIEQFVNGTWEPLSMSRICTMELRNLAPGAFDRFTFENSADLTAGTYRFVNHVHIQGDGMRTLYSRPFDVL